MKPLYTEVFTLKISSTQKRTLEKLKSRNIKVSDFVRKAISEKIKRDYVELQDKPKKEYYLKRLEKECQKAKKEYQVLLKES